MHNLRDKFFIAFIWIANWIVVHANINNALKLLTLIGTTFWVLNQWYQYRKNKRELNK